jgi:hypothetical protein
MLDLGFTKPPKAMKLLFAKKTQLGIPPSLSAPAVAQRYGIISYYFNLVSSSEISTQPAKPRFVSITKRLSACGKDCSAAFSFNDLNHTHYGFNEALLGLRLGYSEVVQV